MNEYATYAELIVMPVGSIVKQPAALSFVEGASIWMMFVTAYSALVEDTKVTKGELRYHPRGVQQCWPGCDSDRQLRRRDFYRTDAHVKQKKSSCSKPAQRR